MKKTTTYSVTLAGKPWTIRFSPYPKKHHGWCTHDKKEIVISTRKTTTAEMQNTLIHEALHALFPYHEESFINAAADELHELLDVIDIA